MISKRQTTLGTRNQIRSQASDLEEENYSKRAIIGQFVEQMEGPCASRDNFERGTNTVLSCNIWTNA